MKRDNNDWLKQEFSDYIDYNEVHGIHPVWPICALIGACFLACVALGIILILN